MLAGCICKPHLRICKPHLRARIMRSSLPFMCARSRLCALTVWPCARAREVNFRTPKVILGRSGPLPAGLRGRPDRINPPRPFARSNVERPETTSNEQKSGLLRTQARRRELACVEGCALRALKVATARSMFVRANGRGRLIYARSKRLRAEPAPGREGSNGRPDWIEGALIDLSCWDARSNT